MEDKQVPEKNFVREKIKDKPFNRKRILTKAAVAALCGAVFALTTCATLYVFMPVIRMEWEESGTVSENGDEAVETGNTETYQGSTENQPQEEMRPLDIRQSLSLEDYQHIQTELYAIGTRANRSIVTITCMVSDKDWFNNSYEREDQGSGTIIANRDGKLYILTEKKVIKDASDIQVTFINEASATAKLMKYDGNTGLAVLSVDKQQLEESTLSVISVMEPEISGVVHKGSMVIALGSPLGTNYSILTGNVTATNNEISTRDRNYSVYTTDIVANQEGSGILINTDGKMVGVVMQDYNTASSNMLMALDVAELEPVMDLLYANRDVPNIGVYVSTVTEAVSEKYGLPRGVYIKNVAMDSPAMSAGLQSGDVIVKLGGERVHNVEEFSSAVLEMTVGQSYPVVVMRERTGGYKKITCKVEPAVLK